MHRRDPAGVAALVLATSVWGASFVLAKIALAELAVTHVLLFRMLFAAGPLLPVLLLSPVKPSRRDLPLIAVTGFLMVPVTFLLQFVGLALSDATSTALVIGTGGPILALAAVLFEGETLGRRGWQAVALSTLGVILLVGRPGPGSHLLGNLLVFLSMGISAVWVLTSKRLSQRYPPWLATGWIVVCGTIFLLPISLLWSGLPPIELAGSTWSCLLGLGLGCTVLAYVAWNWGVVRVGAGPAGIFLNLEPTVGAILGIAWLGEPLTVGILLGGSLILAAALMVSNREREEPEAEAVPAPVPG